METLTSDFRRTGKITLFGADSESNALIAARRVARILQKLEWVVDETPTKNKGKFV